MENIYKNDRIDYNIIVKIWKSERGKRSICDRRQMDAAGAGCFSALSSAERRRDEI